MNKKIMSILTATLVAFTCVPRVALGLENRQETKDKDAIISEIQNLNSGEEKLLIEDTDGVQMFIQGETLTQDTNVNPSTVLNYLETNRALFNFSSDNNSFKVIDSQFDDLGFTHVELKQLFDNKEVYGRNLLLHFNESGNLIGMTGTLENRITSIEKQLENPISEDQAINIAKSSKQFDELSEDIVVKKYIYYKDNAAYDVYKINIVYDTPTYGSWDIFVDSYSGNIIDEVNLIREENVTGSGTAVNGTTRNLNLYRSSGKYYLQDRSKNMSGYINTYTANNRQTTYGSLMYGSSSNITDRAAVSAHSYAEVVYNFYQNMFNRTSIDNSGMSINSVVHYGSRYNNAFWNGYKMVYGDGDGSTFTSLSGDLDVVGHEMTHGVTTNTCNLNYENQPGALNESMSDVFGVLIQTYDKYNVANGGNWQFNASDWVVGDEIYTPNTPGDALRSLANPTLYNQPAHMNNYRNLPNTQQGDYGGVHINSGIPNKAAYNIANSIGCESTAKIYYRALTVYFNTTTSFAQARLGLIQSAEDLFGANSLEAQAVRDGFSAVGIN